LVETQAFAQFLLDRVNRDESDYEIMVFDESIKRKRNRSRLRFNKETTPFLNETSYEISSIYNSTEPNLDIVHSFDEKRQKYDPYDWSTLLEVTPKEILPLISEAEENLMRAHTRSIMAKNRPSAFVNII
jgi:hypothetical protein